MDASSDGLPAGPARVERMALLGELLAESVHEINNLLQPMMGFAQVEAPRVKDEAASRAFVQILAAATKASRMTRALLQFARGSDRKGSGRLQDCLRNVFDLFGHHIDASGRYRFVREVDKSVPAVAMASADLELVLANILKNATDALGNAREGEIRVTAAVREGRVAINVWDSGPQIPEAHMDRIFERFFTTKASDAGTGIGLYSCKRLVEAVGGSLTAMNEPDGGVTFAVELPVAADTAAAAKPEQGVGIAEHLLKGRRILVIDDDKSVLEVMEFVVEQVGGAKVTTCASARDALRILDEESFDAVVLDLRMPGMSGEQLFGSLSEEHRGRVIFVTGDTATASIRGFLSESGRPALFKPVGVDELLETVLAVALN
jgi:CheY-like chemotaxis protein